MLLGYLLLSLLSIPVWLYNGEPWWMGAALAPVGYFITVFPSGLAFTIQHKRLCYPLMDVGVAAAAVVITAPLWLSGYYVAAGIVFVPAYVSGCAIAARTAGAVLTGLEPASGSGPSAPDTRAEARPHHSDL